MALDALTRSLVWAGIAAPFVYAVTVIVGAAIRPGYSHVANAISELIGTGAPNRFALNLGFLAYNLLFVAFAFGVLGAFPDGPSAIRLAGWILAATGALGVVMWWFPMDRIGTPATFAGIGHLVLAGLMSLGTMAAVLGFAIGAGEVQGWSAFATYSYASFAVILVTGGFAAVAAAGRWPTMGLLERLTIGAALQWLAMLAFTLLT